MSFREQDQETKTPWKFPILNLRLSSRILFSEFQMSSRAWAKCWKAVLWQGVRKHPPCALTGCPFAASRPCVRVSRRAWESFHSCSAVYPPKQLHLVCGLIRVGAPGQVPAAALFKDRLHEKNVSGTTLIHGKLSLSVTLSSNLFHNHFWFLDSFFKARLITETFKMLCHSIYCL